MGIRAKGENSTKSKERSSLVVQWLRNLPANAGDTGSFDPWSRKIPHAEGSLLKPAHLDPVLCKERGQCNEKPLLATTGESPHAARKTQDSHK